LAVPGPLNQVQDSGLQSAAMRLRHSTLFLLLLAFLAGESLHARPQQQGQEEIKGEPAEPTDAQAVRGEIALVNKLMPALPDQGAAFYFLATAKRHLRDLLGSLADLKKCVELQEGFDPSGDPAFYGLKGSKDFDDLVEKVHRDFPVVANAREALVTTARDIFPEGLAFDAKKNRFYLSSLYHKNILQFELDGAVTDFFPPDRYGLLPVLGIRPDPSDGSVWADSFSEHAGRAELLHFDSSGKSLGRYGLTDGAKHGFNDLVVLKNGQVITTDSLANKVLQFDPVAHSFTALMTNRPLIYPNGITLSGDGRMLYVADALGVLAINLATRESHDVNPGSHSTLAGADGLYWHDGSLVAIQNGIGAPRIAAFRLSKDGLSVTRTVVLENRTSFTMLPTTGAIRGYDFYFIANSLFDNLNDGQIMDLTALQPVRIGVVHLP
jgi:hypothetical protein